MTESQVRFLGADPIFRVEDMLRSLRFYLQTLEFKLVDWSTPEFSKIYPGDTSIFLCKQRQGAGKAWAYLGVSDVDILHADLLAKGVKIRMPPSNFFYALEMHIEDPDGNVLRLGSDPRNDRPIVDVAFDQS